MSAADIARQLRKDICKHVLASAGVTANSISAEFKISKTCARSHLVGLEMLDKVYQVAQVKKGGGPLSVFYPAGYVMREPVAVAKMKPKVDPGPDFRGAHAVEARQIGMVRDPWVAALFGEVAA